MTTFRNLLLPPQLNVHFTDRILFKARTPYYIHMLISFNICVGYFLRKQINLQNNSPVDARIRNEKIRLPDKLIN